MKEILIFAGTTEGRKLSEYLSASGMAHTLCVATEYGELVLGEEIPLRTVHQGRMSQEQIRNFLLEGSFAAVVDATHPYAEQITENIKAAVKGTDVPCLRLKRKLTAKKNQKNVIHFETKEDCAAALEKIPGNILLTTGSKELEVFCASAQVKSRLFVRILPGRESLELCLKQNICGRQIIAMQGPFTEEMNEAIIRQYDIGCMVTKLSGSQGGYFEKLEAAQKTGIPVLVIGPPEKGEGLSFEEVCRRLEKICPSSKEGTHGTLKITLAGIGMGSSRGMTGEVSEKIREADILLGAERMLSGRQPRIEKKPFYRAGQIIPYLQKLQQKYNRELKVVVLFSGDTGFYSGAGTLYQALLEELNTGRLAAEVELMPGISSIACLAACTGESYQDAAVYSMHGKELCNFTRRIKAHPKTFLLMSGVQDVRTLGESLLNAKMHECRVIIGRQLSYGEQKIQELTVSECAELTEEGLYTCLVKNPAAEPGQLTHGMSDEEFIRAKVPMTKEEIREISICKLKLHKGAVVFDIGSGTGSIAVEMAGLSDDLQVYAVEQKAEAAELIRKNKEKFGLENIHVVLGKAPDALGKLPAATHTFIGGSGGRLKDILEELYHSNPAMRVVINAVSMETISEIQELAALFPIKNEEIVQVQVSRARKAGSYHLMQAENPVWICAFNFAEER